MGYAPEKGLLPLGRSGLKHRRTVMLGSAVMSPSAWKEWIETVKQQMINDLDLSPSAWKEWIETFEEQHHIRPANVSFRLEGVD